MQSVCNTKKGDICQWSPPLWGCTRKIEDIFGLDQGEPIINSSIVHEHCGSPRRVTFDDRDGSGLDGDS